MRGRVSKKLDFSPRKPCPDTATLEGNKNANKQETLNLANPGKISEETQKGLDDHAIQNESKYFRHPEYIPGSVLNTLHTLPVGFSQRPQEWALSPPPLVLLSYPGTPYLPAGRVASTKFPQPQALPP